MLHSYPQFEGTSFRKVFKKSDKTCMHTAITFLKQFGTQNISNSVRSIFVDFGFAMSMNLYFKPIFTILVMKLLIPSNPIPEHICIEKLN